MYFADKDSEISHLIQHIETHTETQEIAPGVHLNRRQLLKWGALGALLANPYNYIHGKKTLKGFEQFIHEIKPYAKTIVTENVNIKQETLYVEKIEQLMTQIHFKKDIPNPWFSLGKGKSMRRRFSESPLAIYDIQFEPNAIIKLHDHKDYNGVIYVLDGEIQVKNFDFYGKRPDNNDDKEFLIQKTQEAVLTKGMTSTLMRKRNNIHEVTAGKQGATVVDVFTFFDKSSTSYYMDWDAKKAFDQDKKLYKAAWL